MHGEGVFVFVIALIFLTAGIVIGYLSGYDEATEEKMKEAFERGYAVQCVGKVGYYWECDE